MAEKTNYHVKDIEADLKRMLNMSSSGREKSKLTENDKDIESELNKILNQSTSKMKPQQEQVVRHASPKPGGKIFRDDLPNPVKESASDNQGRKNKKAKNKGKKQNRTAEQAIHNAPSVQQIEDSSTHHQLDPGPMQGTETMTTQGVKKKKKKKRKRKKNSADAQEGTDETDDSEGERCVIKESQDQAPVLTAATTVLTVKYLDETLKPAVLNELEKERIFPLRKKSTKFPSAKYFCRLCDYHCDNVPVCRQHANDARHRRRKEIMIQDKKLQAIPVPTAEHLAAMDALIDDIYAQQSLSEDERSYRKSLVHQVQESLEPSIPGIQLRMYGSSLTGFALKTSDLNIDLVVEKKCNPAHKLALVYRLLRSMETFPEVKSSFMAKVPAVTFKSPCGSVNCQITVGTDTAYYTSRYLRMYSRMDPRVRKLAVVFRYWAKVCQVDVQENGSLPAYAYGIMTVYFLQQCKPAVLPVIWKVLTEETLRRPKTVQDILGMLEELEKETWTSGNKDCVGQLWRDLLMFYGMKFDLKECIICIRALQPLLRAEKKWKSKRVAIEDPFSPKRNIGRSLHNTRIFDYFYNCLRKACVYFSLPTSHTNISQYIQVKTEDSPQKTEIKCQAEQVTGQSKTLKKSDNNSGTNQKKKNELSEDKTDVIHETVLNDRLEDKQPIERDCDSRNQEHSDNLDESSCEILENSFLESSKASSECKSDSKSDKDNLEDDDNYCEDEKEPEDGGACIHDSPLCHQAKDTKKESSKVGISCEDSCTCEDDSSNELNKQADISKTKYEQADTNTNTHEYANDLAESAERTDDVKTVIQIAGPSGRDVKECASAEDSEESVNGSGTDSDSMMETESPDSSPIRKRVQKKTDDAEYKFVFSVQTLTDGKGPSIFCQICEKEGHLKSNCPEDVLPEIKELPPMTKQHLQLLNMTIQQVPRDFKMSQRELKERKSILANLEAHVQDTFPEAEFCLFGSSENGFGFHQSDLDICVTFRGKKPEDLDFVPYIEAICKKLKSHRGLYNVFPITTAKVPIVKFKHRQSQLEGDISLYNILAQENTRMLYTYSCIDPRVVTLVFAIKVFVKVCDIGDASRGSLSSYAYTLMMLHYLQHTQPPIIPVLQEIQSSERPAKDVIIEGWNAWFYDDLSSLPQVWPDYRQNKQNVGELWFGFFKYYLEDFSFLERVITIRQFEPLTKFEKLWNGRCIAIEDPFDQNHNLGGALSRKMNQFILRTLVHARELYGTPISEVPHGFQSVLDYFFDQEQLTEGEPPSDRLCRVCSKIGHIAKDCPRVVARKEREANERKRKEEMKKANEERDGKIKSRPNTTRSLSDPTEGDSPAKGRTQQYHRTHSYSNDSSVDKRIQTQTFQRYPQPQTQQGMYGQPNQGYYAMNQHYQQTNKKDKRGWRQIQAVNSPGSAPAYYSGPGHVVAGTPMQMSQGQRAYSANGIREYSSANHGQPHTSCSQQHPEGQHQVLLDLNSSVTGEQNYLTSTGLTNTPNVFVPTYMPRAALFAPNMATNTGVQPVLRAEHIQHNVSYSARNQAPFFRQNWFPYATGVPMYINPVPVGQEDAQTDATVQSGSVERSRKVNVHKGPGAVPDVGITVKNEYYRGQEK